MGLRAPVSLPPVRDRFRPGQSGNPAGRPRGVRSLLADKLDRMAESEAPALMQKLVEQARAGDPDSLKFLLSRVWPARKGRLARLPVRSDADPLAVLTAALAAVVGGRLTAEEGEAMARLVEAATKAIDGEALRRIEALDAEPKPRPRLAA